MRSTTRALGALLTLALALPAPVALSQAHTLPRLGAADGGELSLVRERRIGEAIMRELRKSAAVLDDAQATDYLAQLGARLAAAVAPDTPFTFFLVADPSLNAFALPGGFIGVHTGLILAAHTEAELAAVLAHEMAHVTQRHIARLFERSRQNTVTAVATLALAVLAARANPQAAGGLLALGESAQRQHLLAFSREAEREADRVGLEALAQAGYAPGEMARFLTRLQHSARFHNENAPAYLRTHPLTGERIADVQSRIHDHPGAGSPLQTDNHPAFELLRTRLSVLTDPSTDGLRRAQARLEIQRNEASDDTAHGITDYGFALLAHSRRDFGSARTALVQAQARLSHPGARESLTLLAVAIERDAGTPHAALAHLDPVPTTRALARAHARLLLDTRNPTGAIALLTAAQRTWRGDPALWHLLAEAYAANDNPPRSQQAMAEHHALGQHWEAALEQLNRARRTPGLDFYLGSQIDTRIRELAREHQRDQEERKQRL